jgi:hypothetical protein
MSEPSVKLQEGMNVKVHFPDGWMTGEVIQISVPRNRAIVRMDAGGQTEMVNLDQLQVIET